MFDVNAAFTLLCQLLANKNVQLESSGEELMRIIRNCMGLRCGTLDFNSIDGGHAASVAQAITGGGLSTGKDTFKMWL